MNMQTILKKTALSAVLLSTVATPVITHADSEPKTDTVKIQGEAAVKAERDDKSGQIIISKMIDPTELAKQYAPETVEDWQKTLEQFKKVVIPQNVKDMKFNKMSIAAKVSKAEAGAKAGEHEQYMTMTKPVLAEKNIGELKKEIAEKKSGSLQEEGFPAEKLIAAMKEAGADGKISFGVAKPAVKLNESSKDTKEVSGDKAEHGGMVLEIFAGEANEADSPFAKAWDALAKAEESKDADAIRTALSDLLKQFKQAITITEQKAAAK